jgi:hypothetical protein
MGTTPHKEADMTTWYESKTGNHQGVVVDETTGATIAVTYDKANAPLVASAPELLAALEGLHGALDARMPDGRAVNQHMPKEMFEKFHTVASIARQAISKAKGRA